MAVFKGTDGNVIDLKFEVSSVSLSCKLVHCTPFPTLVEYV